MSNTLDKTEHRALDEWYHEVEKLYMWSSHVWPSDDRGNMKVGKERYVVAIISISYVVCLVSLTSWLLSAPIQITQELKSPPLDLIQD